MSKYYNINGLKVRVSDHEPNFSMDRFRGRNDVEFYTVSADNRKLSVIDQIDHYCDKHDLNPALFSEVAKDFPDPEYIPFHHTEKIKVTQEIVDGYIAISGKGSMRKKEKYCEHLGVNSFKMSQGYYTINGNNQTNKNTTKMTTYVIRKLSDCRSNYGTENVGAINKEEAISIFAKKRNKQASHCWSIASCRHEKATLYNSYSIGELMGNEWDREAFCLF